MVLISVDEKTTKQSKKVEEMLYKRTQPSIVVHACLTPAILTPSMIDNFCLPIRGQIQDSKWIPSILSSKMFLAELRQKYQR